METLLVTGCCGRLGKRICDAFANDYNLIGMDVLAREEAQDIANYFQVDLGSDTSVENVFSQIHTKKIASVIHLAAHYSFGSQDWEPYQKITVDGTKRLLKALQAFEVEQFVFSSTLLVYSPCKRGEKISENSPVDPKWAYPASKIIAEEEIFKEVDKMHVCALRIAGVYDDYCHSVPLSHQIQRIYENRLEKHFFPGNLKHGAPFLHMDDLIDATLKIVSKRMSLPERLILILGEATTYSYEELQDQLGSLLLGKKFSTYRIPKWIAKWGAWIQNHLPFYPEPFIKPWMIDIADDHYELDLSLSKELIDWQPEKDVKETLSKMVEALKQDPTTWYKAHGL